MIQRTIRGPPNAQTGSTSNQLTPKARYKPAPAKAGDAPGLSASTITRLKEAWSEQHARWQKRDLSAKRYVYCWADGIHLEARLEEQAQCILVIIGATPEGRKELVGFTDGIRESSQSWRDLLLDLKPRALTTAPQIAVAKPALAKAGGALGFWKALGEVWPITREQRCWVHKTANILNKMPKSLHTKAKRSLQEIWMAETKKDAVTALEAFVETYQVKYNRATDCLIKDRDALRAFYDFPAEHWKHLRTTNPIESTFATVRHRTIRSKGCLSNKTALAMVFKLVDGAQKNWRGIDAARVLIFSSSGVGIAAITRSHIPVSRDDTVPSAVVEQEAALTNADITRHAEDAGQGLGGRSRRCGDSFAKQVAGNVGKREAPTLLRERLEIRLDENLHGLFAGINLDTNRRVAEIDLMASPAFSSNDSVGHYWLGYGSAGLLPPTKG
jgi:hypothetical protein